MALVCSTCKKSTCICIEEAQKRKEEADARRKEILEELRKRREEKPPKPQGS